MTIFAPKSTPWANAPTVTTPLSAAALNDLETRIANAFTAASYWELVTAHGADPTGTSDSTAAFNAALTVGTAVVPAGVYKISGVVTIPASGTNVADLIGAGAGRVVLKLGAGGQIRVGTRAGTGGASPIGGRIIGITIDGNGVQAVSDGQLYLGLITEFTVQGVTIKNGAAQGLVVEGAQNCSFYDLNVVGHTSQGVALDYGCGGLTFFNPEVAYNGGNGTWNFAFQQTGASPAGVYPTAQGPSQIQVIGGRIEAPAQNALGSILHAAGTDNSFIGVGIGTNWATGTTPDTVAALRIQPSTVSGSQVLSTFVTVTGCKMLGAGTAGGSGVGVGIDVVGGGGPAGSGSIVAHTGGTMAGFSKPYRSTQADQITSRDVYASSNGANLWTQKTGDTPVVTQDKVVLGIDPPSVSFSSLGYGSGMSDAVGLPAKYYRKGETVRLAGTIQIATSTAANAVIVALPSWIRPTHQVVWQPPVVNNGAFQNPSSGYLLSINTSGQLSMNIASAGLGGMQVTLDGLSFVIAQ